MVHLAPYRLTQDSSFNHVRSRQESSSCVPTVPGYSNLRVHSTYFFLTDNDLWHHISAVHMLSVLSVQITCCLAISSESEPILSLSELPVLWWRLRSEGERDPLLSTDAYVGAVGTRAPVAIGELLGPNMKACTWCVDTCPLGIDGMDSAWPIVTASVVFIEKPVSRLVAKASRLSSSVRGRVSSSGFSSDTTLSYMETERRLWIHMIQTCTVQSAVHAPSWLIYFDHLLQIIPQLLQVPGLQVKTQPERPPVISSWDPGWVLVPSSIWRSQSHQQSCSSQVHQVHKPTRYHRCTASISPTGNGKQIKCHRTRFHIYPFLSCLSYWNCDLLVVKWHFQTSDWHHNWQTAMHGSNQASQIIHQCMYLCGSMTLTVRYEDYRCETFIILLISKNLFNNQVIKYRS